MSNMMARMVLILFLANIVAAEDPSEKNRWIWEQGQTIQIAASNPSTNDFTKWLSSDDRFGEIISIRIDSSDQITGIVWNICAYADEAMISRLSKIPSLLTAEVLVSKTSLPKAALERLGKAHPEVRYQTKELFGDLTTIVIEKTGSTNSTK